MAEQAFIDLQVMSRMNPACVSVVSQLNARGSTTSSNPQSGQNYAGTEFYHVFASNSGFIFQEIISLGRL
jgi:hypothetical protein